MLQLAAAAAPVITSMASQGRLEEFISKVKQAASGIPVPTALPALLKWVARSPKNAFIAASVLAAMGYAVHKAVSPKDEKEASNLAMIEQIYESKVSPAERAGVRNGVMTAITADQNLDVDRKAIASSYLDTLVKAWVVRHLGTSDPVRIKEFHQFLQIFTAMSPERVVQMADAPVDQRRIDRAALELDMPVSFAQ